MTGNRRELPLSMVAGHRVVPRRSIEGSPCGWTHPLFEAEGGCWSGVSKGLFGGDRPDEAGEFACAGDHDFLFWFAARGHPLPAAVESLLAAPGAFDVGRALSALAAFELGAELGAPARAPG